MGWWAWEGTSLLDSPSYKDAGDKHGSFLEAGSHHPPCETHLDSGPRACYLLPSSKDTLEHCVTGQCDNTLVTSVP